MTSDHQERKPLLYADLFKVHKKTAFETEQHRQSAMAPRVESGSSSGSSSNQLSSFCDSSSSGFSTPFESELGSSESEDGDFISELTRQMAECMLQEDEAEETVEKDEISVHDSLSDDSEVIISPVKYYNELGYVDSAAINNLKYAGLYPGPVHAEDEAQSLQVYHLKNQPRVSKKSAASRVGGTELAQLIHHKTEQTYMQYRVRQWGTNNESGMRAVFLGGSGSKKGSNGTGVFLPRANNDSFELRKKPGCSSVVLEVSEQHFNPGGSSGAAWPIYGSPNRLCSKDESRASNGQPHHENEEMLPQEWTY